jgi:hypothetical protein
LFLSGFPWKISFPLLRRSLEKDIARAFDRYLTDRSHFHKKAP